MTYHSLPGSFLPYQTGCVTVLRCRDHFRIETDQLAALLADVESVAADAIIWRSFADIAERLDRLQAARAAGSYAMLPAQARRLGKIAGGLGLSDVARVAADVAEAADSNSHAAVGATLARLERCFDHALTAVWEVRETL